MALSSRAPPRLVDSGNPVALRLIEESDQPVPRKANRVVSLPNDLGRAIPSQPRAQSQWTISNPSSILNPESSAAQPQNGFDQQPGPSKPRRPYFVQTTVAPQPVTNNQIQGLTTIQHPAKNWRQMKYKIPSQRSDSHGNSNTASVNDSIQPKRSYPSENQQQQIPEIPEPSPASSEPPMNEPLAKRSRRPNERDAELSSPALNNSNSNDTFKEKPVKTLLKDEDTKIFDCPTCHQQYSDFDDLKNHFSFHGKKIQFSCDICGKVFYIEARMENDKSYHSVGDPYLCDFCGVYFDLEFKRKIHYAYCKEDPNNPRKCTRCNKIFEHRKELENHIQDVHCKSLSPIPCIMCNRNAFDIPSLNHHMMKYHQFNGYKKAKVWCDKCGKGFDDQLELDHHLLNIHANDEPKKSPDFVCIKICKESFPNYEMLSEHTCLIKLDIEEPKDVACNDVALGTDHIHKVLKNQVSGEQVLGSAKKDDHLRPTLELDNIPAWTRKHETITEECIYLNTMYNYQIRAARMIYSELRKKYQIMKRADLKNAMDFTSRLIKRINFMEAKITSVLQDLRNIERRLVGKEIKIYRKPYIKGPFFFADLKKDKKSIVVKIKRNLKKITLNDNHQSVQQTSDDGSPEVLHVMNLNLAFYMKKVLPKNTT